jgi:hypothetical protein
LPHRVVRGLEDGAIKPNQILRNTNNYKIDMAMDQRGEEIGTQVNSIVAKLIDTRCIGQRDHSSAAWLRQITPFYYQRTKIGNISLLKKLLILGQCSCMSTSTGFVFNVLFKVLQHHLV